MFLMLSDLLHSKKAIKTRRKFIAIVFKCERLEACCYYALHWLKVSSVFKIRETPRKPAENRELFFRDFSFYALSVRIKG